MKIQHWTLIDNNGFPIREIPASPYLYYLSNGGIIDIRYHGLGSMGIPIAIIDLNGKYSTIEKYLDYLKSEITIIDRDNILSDLGI